MIEKALFLGSKAFGLEVLKSLFFTNKNIKWTIVCPEDQDDTRSVLNDFKEFATENNLELITITSSKAISTIAENIAHDIMIVCGYYRILQQEILNKFKYGAWGIHNSLLPKYRGGSPLVWQIINNESILGSTFFKFDTGVDNGPILEQVKIKNSDSMTIAEATELLQKEWLTKLPNLWASMTNGKFKPIAQDDSIATFSAQRIDQDGIINWKKSATELDRFIRAQSHPYPRAYFIKDNDKVRINEHQLDKRLIYGTPGQVFEVRRDYITVCCGDNTAIKIKTLEVRGEKLLASEYIRSFTERL